MNKLLCLLNKTMLHKIGTIVNCPVLTASYRSLLFRPPVLSNSLRPRALRHARLPCLSPTPEACSNSCPSSGWCHPTISYSVIPFYCCLQSFPASRSFPTGQLFTSGSQSIGASTSASDLQMNIQGLNSLLPKGLSRVFSNITVQRHQFSTHPLLSKSYICTWLLEKP